MRRLGSIAVLAALSLGVAACTGDPDSGDSGDVKIGGLWPLSGPNATQGTDVLHGAELAVEIVNGVYPDLDLPMAKTAGLPGLNGRRLQLVTGDHQGKPELGAAETDRLISQEKVVALTGAYQSGVTLTASAKAEQYRIPFLNGESSSPALTERGLKYFFRTSPSDLTFAESMFDYIEVQKGKGKSVKTVAILQTNDQYGNDGAAATEKLAKERGLDVVAKIAFEANAADLSSQVTQLKGKNPDVLFVLAYTDAAIKLMNALDQLDYAPPALLAYGAGFADPKFAEGLGAKANGASTRAAWSAEIAEKRPSAKTIADLFQSKYGQPMTENSARSFTATLALAQAIDNAKSTEATAIRDALATLDIAGDKTIMPWKGIKFDEKGQNTGAQGVVQQMIEGKYRVVFPVDVATTEPVWPMRKSQG